MLARRRLLEVQRAMYQRLSGDAQPFLGQSSPELKRYYLQYLQEFNRFGRLSNRRELMSSLLQSHVALCGDYHTLPDAQKWALECLAGLLPRLRAQGRGLVVGLEMLPAAHSVTALRWLRGEMDEGAFLRRIRFQRSWGFPWESYRPLFEFCREQKVPILGLNGPSSDGDSSLRERDRFGARRLRESLRSAPEALHFVLVGDWHLAGPHLPAALAEGSGPSPRVTVVHQNPDPIYWKLAERGLGQGEAVVRLRRNVFCQMHTPPWIKLRSVIHWGEGGTDRAMDAGLWDPGDELWEVVEALCRVLELDVPDDEPQVCGPEEVPRILRRSVSGGANPDLVAAYLRRFSGVYLPPKRLVVLSSWEPSVIAQMAGVYLHSALSGRQRLPQTADDFFPQVWVEALGFFAARLVQPSSKPSRTLLPLPPPPSRRPSERTLVALWEQARYLGAVLGSRLYDDLAAGRLSPHTLRELFREPFHSHQEAAALYLQWRGRLAK